MATYLYSRKILAKRKHKIYKRKLFRHRFFLIFKLLVVVSFLVTLLIFLKNLFSLKETIIEFNVPFYKAEDILKAGSIKKGSSIFFCDEKRIKENIEKKLPFAKVTDIKKKLPNKLLMKIDKINGFAAFKIDESFVVTDESLKVLEIVPKIESSLTLIDGADLKNYNPGDILTLENMQQKAVLFDLLEFFHKNSLKSVTSVNVKDLENIEILYENRILIKFGSKKDLEKKTKAMIHILKDKIKNDESGDLDLSDYQESSKIYFLPRVENEEIKE